MPNYENMSVEELEKKNIELSNERAKIRNEQKKVNAIREKKLATEGAKKKFSSMSPADKEAMAQVISNAGGIASKEDVGSPGATD